MPQPCVRIDGGYALEKPWKVVQNASNSSPAADNRFDLPGGTAACWDGPECSFRISGCEGRREACSAHNGRTKGDLTACRAAPTLRCRSLGRGLPSWLGVSTGFLQSCCRRLMRDHAATAARQGVALAACRHEATTNQPVDFLEGSTRAQMCSKSEDTRNLLIVNCSTCGSCAV